MEQPFIRIDVASGTGVALFRHLSQDIDERVNLDTIARSLALCQQAESFSAPLLIERISLLLTEELSQQQSQALVLIFECFLENRLDEIYRDSPLRHLSESLVQPMQPAFDTLLLAAACSALLNSGDLRLSLSLLKDPELIHTAYWYQYEHEFKATLGTTESGTRPVPALLALLLAQKSGPDVPTALERIAAIEDLQSACREYDVFHEYISLRRQWLARIGAVLEEHKTSGADQASPLAEALIDIQEKYVSYFRTTHVFQRY
ncbi:hypothetical protein KV580_02575 [Pseudomonas chlororaphis]|nr:hypothetical protein [Pseudomonas chlororaphis]